MKEKIIESKVIIALILVTVILAMTVIGARIGIEKNNKTYDIVLDYAEIEKMAEQKYSVKEWLSEFKKIGITKVGLQEENIMTLMEDSDLPVTGEVMGNVMENAKWREELPETFLRMVESKGGFDRFDVLVTAGNRTATDFLYDGITNRIDRDRYVAYVSDDGATGYFWLDGTSDTTLYSEKYKYMNSTNGGFIERIDIVGSKIMYISLGLLEEKVDLIQDLGMEIVPRTLAYNGWNGEKYANAVLDEYEKYDIDPEYIIVGGEAVIGYDDGIDFAKDYIIDNDVTIGLIENTTQLQNIMQYGVSEVAVASDFDTVRVFSVWNYIQYRYQYYGYEGSKEIENTLFRAVTERNVRVIYFKPFLELKDLHTYVTDMEEYELMFDNLEKRLEKHGFTFGSASVMANYSVNKFVQMGIAIGAALGAVLILRSLFPMGKMSTLIVSVLAVLTVPAAYFVMPNTAILITSFTSAVVFACLAVIFFTECSCSAADSLGMNASVFKIILGGLITLAGSVLIALIGGMMTAAPISSTSFMLEIDIFRGVKLSQLLPLAFFLVLFVAYYGFVDEKKREHYLEWYDIRELLNLEIRVWMILCVGVIGLVGAYYIMRTGHDSSIEVSSVEMLFRNKLEEVLVARPRTKEVLFAFPAVMVMFYCAVRRLKLFTLIFGLAGTIGMTSVINTFMHIRTPLYLGFARTGYSLLGGAFLGVVAVLILEVLYQIYVRFFGRYV
ncbi:MAG: hypothetical protein E7225_00700 [Clostridiales bacterium]|nr:hypothetical protein [Clostridiales bacterium]